MDRLRQLYPYPVGVVLGAAHSLILLPVTQRALAIGYASLVEIIASDARQAANSDVLRMARQPASSSSGPASTAPTKPGCSPRRRSTSSNDFPATERNSDP